MKGNNRMKVRKQEQVDAFKQRILDCAIEILKEEGIQGLSMRKISKRLDYTQGILYHYFKNKDELLAALTFQGYQGILQILQEVANPKLGPSQQLGVTLKAYMEGMLAQPDIFLIMMTSNDPCIYEQVNLLAEGIRERRESIQQLCMCIDMGVRCGEFACEHVERRAQSIWCATFGMIERLHKEQIQDPQKTRLIEEHIEMIVQSLEVKE